MMGIQNGQIQMIILDIDSMIPENHLLLTVGFVGLISCTEYRIIPLSARTENNVLRMPVSSGKFLMRLF